MNGTKLFHEWLLFESMHAAEHFVPRINRCAPQHGAILPSEMLVFCTACVMSDCDLIIESGRRFGYSTDVLTEWDRWHVISIDLNPNKHIDNRLRKKHTSPEITRGEGTRLVPQLVERYKDSHKIGLLLDGPKGIKAYNVFNEVRDDICVCGIHDVYSSAPLRPILQSQEKRICFTDRPDFVEHVSYLDRQSLEYRGYASAGELLAFGSVLAVIPGGRWPDEDSVPVRT